MKTTGILLVVAVPALAGAGLPAALRGQTPTPFVIDVAKPDSVVGRRFKTRDRFQVQVRNLNPFAGNYRVVVKETAYSDSAIIRFLGGLGVSVAAEAPKSQAAAASASAATVAANSARSLLRSPPSCPSADPAVIETAQRVAGRFAALVDTLRTLEAQDDTVRERLRAVTSERSVKDSVMRALGSALRILARTESRHGGLPYHVLAAALVSDAENLARLLSACPSLHQALSAIVAQRDGVDARTRWRDTLEARLEQQLPALRLAESQAAKLFDHVFAVGDYDQPTTVDIQVQRQPLGPLDFVTAVHPIARGTGTGARLAAENADSAGGDSTPAPGSPGGFEAGWRTIADVRLAFGDRRRIGLSGALAIALGPPTSTYGTVYAAVTDTLTSIAVSRHERAVTPLLTLTTRVVRFQCLGMGCAFNLLLGVTPSVTPRQTYFGGIGLAFADERIGLMAGGLSLPVQELAEGFSPGDRLNTEQTSAPTRDARVWRWAVGVNLRPF